MTTVIERLQSVSSLSGSREVIQAIDEIERTLIELRSSLTIVDTVAIPRAAGLETLSESFVSLQKITNQAGNIDREALVNVAKKFKSSRDLAKSQVMVFEDGLGNLRQLAQAMGKDNPAIEKIQTQLAQSAATMNGCASRLGSISSGNAAPLLLELDTACKNVKHAQKELITELGVAMGTTFREEILERIGSCRPLPLGSLTPDELQALRNSRLRDFLSLTLSPPGK